MTKAEIRPMRAADIDGMAALFAEMQAHYRVPCPPAETIRRDLAALPPGTTILVAARPAPVGFAALCTIYPGPGLGAGLFLKELYVSTAARGAGLGSALLQEAARQAVERGFGRIDWTADRQDARLLEFYDSLGGMPQNEKLFFRLSGEPLRELARGEAGPRSS